SAQPRTCPVLSHWRQVCLERPPKLARPALPPQPRQQPLQPFCPLRDNLYLRGCWDCAVPQAHARWEGVTACGTRKWSAMLAMTDPRTVAGYRPWIRAGGPIGHRTTVGGTVILTPYLLARQS